MWKRENSRVGKTVLLGCNGCLRKISFHHNMGISFSVFNRNGWMGLDCPHQRSWGFKMTTKK